MQSLRTWPYPEPIICTSFRTLTQFVCRQSIWFTIHFHLLKTVESWWARNNYKIHSNSKNKTKTTKLFSRKHDWQCHFPSNSEHDRNLETGTVTWKLLDQMGFWAIVKLEMILLTIFPLSSFKRFMNMQMLFWTIMIPIWTR